MRKEYEWLFISCANVFKSINFHQLQCIISCSTAAHNRKFFVWEAFVAHVELSSFYKLYDGVAFELEGVLLFVNGCVFVEDL